MHLTDKDIADIITTAAEGGINYWGDVRACSPRSLTVYDREGNRFCQLDAGHIQRAVNDILDRRIGRDDLRAAIVTDSVDAEAADVIIQVAAFGEIVYG